MTMDTPQNTEIKLNDVMFLALDHGMDSIDDDSAPLIPMAFIENEKGERTLQRFVTERLEEGVERAKQFVAQNKDSVARYAITWDGFITVQGRKWDAILVEAGDRFQETGYLMCQRYEKKGLLNKKNVPCGNPALIEKPPSRIRK